ncbi:uncharacterized protein C9orf85 homolog [Pleurodeles waltl]|uniref:uncharacterized protein C9orf85 homolog n=1 Tax=Pleurodeles waltl TaxID=8319 RepID=UPI0037099F80
MSSQRGNVSRTRPQRHQNETVFKNNKFDTSSLTKKLNTKVHEAVCQHCKEVLEWRVKYKKFKALTQPKKCVKCLQKTVKDAYHIICKPCASKLEICAKCGKKEEIVVPIEKGLGSVTKEEGKKDVDELDFEGEDDDDYDEEEDSDHDNEDGKHKAK